jgi:prolyl-tRNA editing enzyme YbaK/EbsC (Cys-tRNA(Pro) deacylase)
VYGRPCAYNSPVDHVRASLIALGVSEPKIKTFPESTATAEQAAAAIGTSVERIVKSLVFMAGTAPILVLVSGSNHADTTKLESLLGSKVKRASADQVHQATGFAIGGVPPVGHPEKLQTYIDQHLLGHEEVWAAAGTHTSVFPISPHTLVSITSGHVADIT